MTPARPLSHLAVAPGCFGVLAYCHRYFCRLSMVFILLLAPVSLSHVHACGLEHALRGGLAVSYPGALDVAVAVADSRRSGLLPPADPGAVSNEVIAQQMLADLRRLQSRLNASLQGNEENTTAAFSLVLVGPGLWSHYHPAAGGIRAEYHTSGPMAGKAVILTHHAVLRALLSGDLNTVQAAELGLVAYSGIDAAPARNVFEAGFQSNS